MNKFDRLKRKIYSKKYRSQISDARIILQPDEPGYGFFAHFINFCGELKWAFDMGKKPYIDMATFPNGNILPEEVGKTNAWELFFEQPCSFAEDELQEIFEYKDSKLVEAGEQCYVYNSKAGKKAVYLVRKHMGKLQRPSDSCDFLYNEKAICFWREFIEKNMRLNEKMLKYVEEMKKSIIPDDANRILGVLLRGTDFTNNRPKNHPICPTVEEAIPDIERIYNSGKFDYIFLASEDQKVVDQMKEHFGNKILMVPQQRVSDVGGKLLYEVCMENKEIDVHKWGYDYISSMMILSQCKGFMACRTSGAVAAYLFGKEYDDVFFWNLGRYVTDEYPS